MVAITTEEPNISYHIRAGLSFPEEPTWPYEGDWHFATGGGGGAWRPISGSLGNTLRIIVVGDGTLTVTFVDPSEGVTGNWGLYHRDEGAGGDPTLDDSAEGFTIGDEIVIPVSTHDGANCVHWIDFSSTGPGGADGYGYNGCSWQAS